MLILPDKKVARNKVLMPVLARDWMRPSQRQSMYGAADEQWWRITAVHPDDRKRIMWVGCFADRDDCDAFLLAALTGSLVHEPELWPLSLPAYHPDIFGEIQPLLAVSTVTILLTTGAGTYTRPVDWDNAHNKVECLASGSSGARGSSSIGGSGGGGAYAAGTNLTIASSVNYTIGAAAAGVTVNGNGNAGAITTFDGTTLGACQVGAAAPAAPTSTTGSTGGLASSSVGATKFNGGTGSNQTTGGTTAGSGGAAGPAGAGGNGSTSGGGSANNGTTVGPASNAVGNAGQEWQTAPQVGCGTGGATFSTGKAGGNYGAGGTGCNTGTSGAGTQGVLVTTYTPLVAGNASGFLIMFN